MIYSLRRSTHKAGYDLISSHILHLSLSLLLVVSICANLAALSLKAWLRGPQIHLELQHSRTLAPLDAMPYWLCPTSSTSSIPDVESDGLRLTRLTLRRLDVMAGAMERAMAMGKCLEIQERYSRCSTLIQDRVWPMLIVLFFQVMIQEDGNLEIS